MCAERLRREIERGHFVQRAVGLAAPARGAHGVVDECVGHDSPSSSVVRDRRYRFVTRLASGARRQNYKLRAISSFMISLVPRIDAQHARVAVEARDRVFVHIAIAAEQLQAAVDHVGLRVG